MMRLPPRSTLTDALVHYTTLVRSQHTAPIPRVLGADKQSAPRQRAISVSRQSRYQVPAEVTAVETLVNSFRRPELSSAPPIASRIATSTAAIRPTIRPYSMAVAPSSSRRKFITLFNMASLLDRKSVV